MGGDEEKSSSPHLKNVAPSPKLNPRSLSTPSETHVQFFDPTDKINDADKMELLPPQLTTLTAPPAIDAKKLMESFFQNKSPGTLKAYRQDLQSFMAFVGVNTLELAAIRLLGHGQGHANHIALQFKNHLHEKKLAPASINRKLAALKSLCKLGRVVGVVAFSLEVEGFDVEPLRDTRGPGSENVRKMLLQAEQRTDKKGKRDYAMLRLMFDLAMRRGEVCSLDVEHIDLAQGLMSIMGKGRHQRQWLSLPDETKDALKGWMEIRGKEPGALFVALDPRAYGRRLRGDGAALVIGKMGERIGARVRPHGLRHAAITEALNATDGNLRLVQKYSRHRCLDMLLVYDDARGDFGGQVAKLVAKSTRERKNV